MSHWRKLSASMIAAVIVTPAMADEHSDSKATSAVIVDQISMESYSWGRLSWKWAINSDGSGELTSTTSRSNNSSDRVAVVKHWGASPGRYEKIRDMLAPAKAYAGKTLPCSLAITDLPYGNVAWRHGDSKQALSFDLGCRSDEANKLYGQMRAAYGLISTWSAEDSTTGPSSG